MSPLDVAPFERQATAEYGRLRAVLEKKGQMIGSMDLLIAAHAVSLGVRLVTHNSREFRRVPALKIEDLHRWWSAKACGGVVPMLKTFLKEER